MDKKIDVLNNGYVRMLKHYGDDLDVVNNARASYDKEVTEMDATQEGLIRFLAREGHMSPFRSPRVTFEVYAPLMIARQWWKYAIDSSHIEDGTPWNESSRRYITEDVEYYLPGADEWRTKPANSKQGSGPPMTADDGMFYTKLLRDYQRQGEALYEDAMRAGIAPEQARLFLPAYGLMVRWRYTASLQSICHMLDQRLKHDTQHEFQQYAKAVHEHMVEVFPVSVNALIPTEGEKK